MYQLPDMPMSQLTIAEAKARQWREATKLVTRNCPEGAVTCNY
ncbi:hypothetical protein ACFO6W_05680 [Dysgonomonas termitidis]|uniref:Uncharacterized protein n=1 Tax=Dysgonomonas termitidis TaxID=1516126 RepID=A0ABV9KT10_9BACT